MRSAFLSAGASKGAAGHSLLLNYSHNANESRRNTGRTTDDFLATIGLTRVMNRWVVPSLENKLNGDDSFTLGVELDEQPVLLVDDDETVILTFKYMFSTGEAPP